MHRKHHVASYRLIQKLHPLLGITGETLHQVALVARFHRGALPHDQRAFSGTSVRRRKEIILLAGILRLANALADQKSTGRLLLERSGDALFITVPEYSGSDPSAEKIAAARHLLENTCRLPILVR
jgi:hypothetical protein